MVSMKSVKMIVDFDWTFNSMVSRGSYESMEIVEITNEARF